MRMARTVGGKSRQGVSIETGRQREAAVPSFVMVLECGMRCDKDGRGRSRIKMADDMLDRVFTRRQGKATLTPC